ncbi:DUF6090 family protein [Winogradskyella sp. A3E31]|uniref:DUF6090 family protein n=1 Tax=Winogradskyella sp. A3E31 TaxID=3349637 RepID=UPI00398A55F0
MIKFFRHIRRSLIQKNQMGKYFKYAIGEILLVVIGILIALQINNWNEDRKTRMVEVKMLKNIKNSLVSDIKNQINPNLDQLELDMRNIEDIKNFFEISEVHHDSMNLKYKTLMYSKNHDYEVTSYKALENEGLHIIQNPELKSRILKLYNMSYPEIEFTISNFSNNLMTFFRPNMRELFNFLDDNRMNGYSPVDYVQLKNNRDFKNNLIVCTENCQNIYNATTAAKTEVEDLIEMIDIELKHRD